MQAAVQALEKWFETEGVSAGADAAALKSISAAVANRDAAAQRSKSGGGGWRLGRRRRQQPSAWLKSLPPDIAARCAGTAGDWCGRYLMQTPIPAKVAVS